MLKDLTKKQTLSLLSLLDTLASLSLAPEYTIIWTPKSRTILDMRWNITRNAPGTLFNVSLRAFPGSKGLLVLDIIEDDL